MLYMCFRFFQLTIQNGRQEPAALHFLDFCGPLGALRKGDEGYAMRLVSNERKFGGGDIY